VKDEKETKHRGREGAEIERRSRDRAKAEREKGKKYISWHGDRQRQ
jgi:hypothetical protein